jgi:hypothetical protein
MIAKIKSISSIRWIRMGLGMFFVFAGFGEKRWGIMAIGGFVFLQGLMDWGCGFQKNSCGVPISKSTETTDFDADKAFKK